MISRTVGASISRLIRPVLTRFHILPLRLVLLPKLLQFLEREVLLSLAYSPRIKPFCFPFSSGTILVVPLRPYLFSP